MPSWQRLTRPTAASLASIDHSFGNYALSGNMAFWLKPFPVLPRLAIPNNKLSMPGRPGISNRHRLAPRPWHDRAFETLPQARG